jgi:ABC-type transporter Mla subunit MlaD
MRRAAAILVLLGACGALLTFVFGGSAQGSGTSSFDVIFDDARGLIGGQLVKVAGAQAGTINNVVVTSNFKARVEASIESQFMPFRTNATCTIRPEGLIAENYIDCDPGSPPAPILKGENGFPPTVPVQNTSEPVSLLDLFNIFNVPTRERFAALISELGIGTAGEGQNFNDILRRANPALALARQVIGILARQKAQLATIIDATNTIASDAASHTTDVQNFLDRASALSTLTASHASNLALAINRLPGLLSAAQPALQQLDTVAVDATPLVQQIHASTPELNQVADDLGPFVKVAKPALRDLGGALEKAIPAIRETTPLVKTLRQYIARSLPGTKLVARLFVNLQQHGFTESLISLFYYVASSLARYDSTSHLLSVLLIGPDNGVCGTYATTPVAACNAHYGSGPKYKPTAAIARASRHAERSHARASGKPSATAPAQTGSTSTPTAPATAGTGSAAQSGAAQIIQKLLGGTTGPSTGATGTTGSTGGNGNPSSALQGLLNYLIK